MLLLVPALVAGAAWAQSLPVHDVPRDSSQSAALQGRLPELAGRVEVLRDPGQSLGLADVLRRSGDFTPTQPNTNFGYTYDGIWLRLVLPATEQARGVLMLQPNFLDTVDFYVATEQPGLRAADFKRIRRGDHRPYIHDGASGITEALRLDFEPGETKLVYINIRNRNSSTLFSLQLVPEASYPLRMGITGLIYGTWFGGMTVLALIQMVFFYFDRKPQYPLLALSTVGVMLVYMGNLGISRPLFFADNAAGSDFALGFNAWAGLTVSVLSCISILDIRKKPWPLQTTYYAVGLAGLVGIGFAVLGGNILFGPVGSALAVFISILNMLVALYYRYEDGTAGQMRALAYVLTGIGVTLALLQRMSALALPNYIGHAYGISALLQMLLLTGAMAVRLRDAERQSRALRLQELYTAQSAEKIAATLVEYRTRELVEARHIAEEALRVELEAQEQQVRFFEAVSHQYRTPLAIIRSTIDGIGLSLRPDDQSNRDRIARVRRAIAGLVDILELNLARSQVQGGAFRSTLAPVAVGALALSALARARSLMPGSEILLDFDPPGLDAPDFGDPAYRSDSTAEVMADSGMIELALVNLIENAVKYSAPASGLPVVLGLRRHIDAPGGEFGDEIEISVTDHGLGIPPEALSEVMKSGYRASNVRNVMGSGLGLFLVDRIVKAHSGRIEIESVVEQGTTVRIFLPVLPEEEDSEPLPEPEIATLLTLDFGEEEDNTDPVAGSGKGAGAGDAEPDGLGADASAGPAPGLRRDGSGNPSGSG